MSWNWLGWLLWLLALVLLGFVIHYIRVHQLMLIAKTGHRFEKGLFLKYVVLLVVALAWLGTMLYFTAFRKVALTSDQVTVSYSYDPLQLTNDNTNDYYYVRANHSSSGDHHVVSYTYWTTTKKVTVGAMNASIADSNDILSSAAVTYPWNESKLRKEDQATSRAFAAKITVRYKNNLINGLGLRANKEADEHTLIRVPAANLIEQAKNGE